MTPSLAKRGMSARGEMLGVLDAEAAIARAVFGDDTLEGVEEQRVGAIADRVHHHVKAGFVGTRNPAIQVFGCIDQQPAIVRRVVEGLMKRGRMRTKRAIDKALQAADAQPFVAAAVGAAVFLPRDTTSRRRSHSASGITL